MDDRQVPQGVPHDAMFMGQLYFPAIHNVKVALTDVKAIRAEGDAECAFRSLMQAIHQGGSIDSKDKIEARTMKTRVLAQCYCWATGGCARAFKEGCANLTGGRDLSEAQKASLRLMGIRVEDLGLEGENATVASFRALVSDVCESSTRVPVPICRSPVMFSGETSFCGSQTRAGNAARFMQRLPRWNPSRVVLFPISVPNSYTSCAAEGRTRPPRGILCLMYSTRRSITSRPSSWRHMLPTASRSN